MQVGATTTSAVEDAKPGALPRGRRTAEANAPRFAERESQNLSPVDTKLSFADTRDCGDARAPGPRDAAPFGAEAAPWATRRTNADKRG